MSYGLQTDIPYSNGKFYNISKHIPGRVMTDDFVFFNIPNTINPKLYGVYMSSNDGLTNGEDGRFIGNLSERVELPHVYFDAYGLIYVEPKNKDRRLPFYVSRLNRGSTYNIPRINTPGTHQMHRTGILTAGASF